MPDLSTRRGAFKTVIIVLLVLDIAAVIYLVSPLGISRGKRQQQRDQLQQQLQVRKREVVPLRDLDKKLLLARQEIDAFYRSRFAGQYSAITDELGKVAQENNVHISNAKYGMEDADIPGLRRVSIEAGVDGDYLQIVKFINALERDKMFFIVDSVALSEQQGGTVRLQVKMETYLKA